MTGASLPVGTAVGTLPLHSAGAWHVLGEVGGTLLGVVVVVFVLVRLFERFHRRRAGE